MAETSALQGLLDSLSARLSAVEQKLGVSPAAAASSGGGASASSSSVEEDAKQIRAFDAYCRECLDPFVAACDALGAPEATRCGELVKNAWAAMRGFLVMASKCKKPSDFPGAVMPFVEPCQSAMKEAAANVSRGDWECHQKTVSEGLGCLSWLLVEPAPRDFIENFIGGQDFWANKIRVKYKKTEPNQIKYCDTFKKLIVDLMPYVKEYHMTGVAYNPKGIDVKSYAPSSGSAAPPAAAAAAPKAAPKAASSGGGGGLGDLKAALGGGNVTSGLKKVTKDMQTWRSEYKGGGDAPVPTKKAVVAPRKPAQKVTRGPPVFEFQQRGMKWLVENQTKENGVITVTMDPTAGVKHTVYICSCYEATIDIKGKCKGVAIDGCVKCNVLFDSAISSMEVVNSKSMKCQARGTVPSVAIDKTDGILTYLSKETLDTTVFVTSKSSDMQISFPNDAGDMVEAPIPEQFVHKASLVGEKPQVSSDVSDLYSH